MRDWVDIETGQCACAFNCFQGAIKNFTTFKARF